MAQESSQRRFFGYPDAVKAPVTPYEKKDDANPVISGNVLVIGAWLVSKVPFIQRFLWLNAGFNGLRKVEDLKSYTERWDPIVIPFHPGDSYTPTLEPSSFKPLASDGDGDKPQRYHSILDYHALYKSGELTPLAVASSLLPLIRRDIDNPSKHATAFIDCHSDVVIEAAKASTLRYQAGKPLSILDGIPTAFKDDIAVTGYGTGSGRKQNDSLFPAEITSAWPVQKWEEAGGIVLGKLNQHEIGADTTNNNPNWGTPKNPHNDQYYTGGSSGGAAYAVSTGLIPLAIGTDGGGSVRIPASFCGIYGLKPSHGRVECDGSTVTVKGPLAANMMDLEAAYRLMMQPDPSDSTAALFSPPGPIDGNHSKVIGIYRPWFDRADAAVLSVCHSALDHFRDKLGYSVVDIEMPYLPEGQTAHAFTILCEMANRARGSLPKSSESNWLSEFNPANKILLAVANQTPARDYILGQQMRQMLMQHLAFLYQKHPGLIIVTPTSPTPGWPIGKQGDLTYGITDGNTSIRNMEYVWLANFCGNPAITCPVGYVEPTKGKGKIPVGLMAMGEWGSEDSLLAWGREAESWLNDEHPGGRQTPSNWVDVIAEAKLRL